MENDDKTNLNSLLDKFFSENLKLSEEKLESDYGALRELSKQFAEMYHELNEDIIPTMNQKPDNTTATETRERAKTPVRVPGSKLTKTPIAQPKKEEVAPRHGGTQHVKRDIGNKDRSKTPIIDNKRKKEGSDLGKSHNELKKSGKQKSNKELPVMKEPKKSFVKRDSTPNKLTKNKSHVELANSSVEENNKSRQKAENSSSGFKKEEKKTPGKRGTAMGTTLKNPIQGGQGKKGEKRYTTIDKNTINMDKVEIKKKEEDINEAMQEEENAPEVKQEDNTKPEENKVIQKELQGILGDKSAKSVEKALFLASRSGLMDLNTLISLATSVKFMYENCVLNFAKNEKITKLEEKIKEKEQFLNLHKAKINLENILSKPFSASKTAQNGLNFVTKEEEQNLMKKEQQEEIINVFKLIYIMLDEPCEEIPQEKLIPNLFTNLYKKYSAENLKSLFLNQITKKVEFTREQNEKVRDMMNENPNMLSSSHLIKLNRSVSYMTFIMKEIYDFNNQKVEGTPINELREVYQEINSLKQSLNGMK